MNLPTFLCLALSACCQATLSPTAPTAKKILTLGGIFDINTKVKADNSANMIPAVQMAIKHVNENPYVLKDYHLELDIKDVKCSDAYSIKALVEYIKEEKQKIMIIGPGCSESAEPFAKAASFYNLVQISMANANPSLSCKKIYKTFVRTIPPEHYQNMGRVGMVNALNWKNVAVVQELLDTFQGLSNDLIEKLKKAKVNIVSHETFKGNASNALDNIKRKDGRIMFGIFRESTARQVVCQAYKLGMWGPKYVWILMSGSYHAQWWKVNDTSCTTEQLKKGLGPYLGTRALLHDGNSGVTVAGKTVKVLQEEYDLEIVKGSYQEPHIYASFAYDALWTAALILNRSLGLMNTLNETRGMTLTNFTYDNEAMRKLFMESIRHITFKGMSGNIVFDRKYERLGTLQLEQLQGDTMADVGTFCMITKTLTFHKETKVVWQGEKRPICKRKTFKEQNYVHLSVFYFMSSFCVLGIIMAVVFLIFNIKYSGVRYIKLSSPRLNNIILTGCILIYASGIIAGIDGNFVSEKMHGNLCQVQAWLASAGFTLAFGALFSKTWRVHVIFLNKTEKKVIKDPQLFGLVFAFLLIDLCVLVCWHCLDPMFVINVDMMPETLYGGDTLLIRYHSQCTSNHLMIWTGALYGYKGFLLLFGTYLAWETRKVTIAVLNDSKMIGIAVYNVVIPCVLVIPMLHVIKNNVSAIYGMTSLLCILCTTVTQCLIFLPKVIYICQDKHKLDNAASFSTIPKNKDENLTGSLNNSCNSFSTNTQVTLSASNLSFLDVFFGLKGEDAYSFKPSIKVSETNDEKDKPQKKETA